MPMTGFRQIARISELCEASIPDPLASAMEDLQGDERAEFELGVAYATQQCADLLRRGAPGIHLYALNRWPAARAILGALHASKPWEERDPGAAAPAGAT
jgi:methylenetetrahydrofolate reductase (NADPH)